MRRPPPRPRAGPRLRARRAERASWTPPRRCEPTGRSSAAGRASRRTAEGSARTPPRGVGAGARAARREARDEARSIADACLPGPGLPGPGLPPLSHGTTKRKGAARRFKKKGACSNADLKGRSWERSEAPRSPPAAGSRPRPPRRGAVGRAADSDRPERLLPRRSLSCMPALGAVPLGGLQAMRSVVLQKASMPWRCLELTMGSTLTVAPPGPSTVSCSASSLRRPGVCRLGPSSDPSPSKASPSEVSVSGPFSSKAAPSGAAPSGPRSSRISSATRRCAGTSCLGSKRSALVSTTWYGRPSASSSVMRARSSALRLRPQSTSTNTAWRLRSKVPSRRRSPLLGGRPLGHGVAVARHVDEKHRRPLRPPAAAAPSPIAGLCGRSGLRRPAKRRDAPPRAGSLDRRRRLPDPVPADGVGPAGARRNGRQVVGHVVRRLPAAR